MIFKIQEQALNLDQVIRNLHHELQRPKIQHIDHVQLCKLSVFMANVLVKLENRYVELKKALDEADENLFLGTEDVPAGTPAAEEEPVGAAAAGGNGRKRRGRKKS